MQTLNRASTPGINEIKGYGILNYISMTLLTHNQDIMSTMTGTINNNILGMDMINRHNKGNQPGGGRQKFGLNAQYFSLREQN
jgi:hypothetical protein